MSLPRALMDECVRLHPGQFAVIQQTVSAKSAASAAWTAAFVHRCSALEYSVTPRIVTRKSRPETRPRGSNTVTDQYQRRLRPREALAERQYATTNAAVSAAVAEQ